MKAVIVFDEGRINKIEDYRQFVYSGQPIKGNTIDMDTTIVPINEEVSLIKYLNDSSIAVIRFNNKWFRDDVNETNINSRTAHGYISVLDLHK